MDHRPPLVVTPGEPAGIGAEISLKAWQAGLRKFCLIDQPEHIIRTAEILGISINPIIIDSPSAFDPLCDALQIIPLTWAKTPVYGVPDPANAPQVIEAIRQAAEWSRTGIAAGLVTNPIQKSSLYEAGFTHPGHTEFLASLSDTADGGPLMMLTCDQLRVVPATIHIPLSAVPAAISTDLILQKVRLMHTSLQNGFGINTPRIAVCGLNPHAGENGSMGDEDIRIIAPAIDQLKAEGIAVTGPHPADTLFHLEARQTYDAVLGIYHDQVLIPLKTIDFFGGVNITLGLDIVRTSPDHGTGLDIAGTGIARADSMIAALEMAERLSRKLNKTSPNN